MNIEFVDASYGIGRGLNIDTFTNPEDIVMHTVGAGSIGFITNQIEQMRIDASGVVTISNKLIVENQICFKAYGPSTGALHNTNGEPVKYSAVTENIGGYYDSTTYTFTSPTNGTYFFYASYNATDNLDHNVYFIKNTNDIMYKSGRTGTIDTGGNVGDPTIFNGSILCDLSKNDTMKLVLNTGTINLTDYSQFGGYLLG